MSLHCPLISKSVKRSQYSEYCITYLWYYIMYFRLSKLPNANNCELLLGRFTLSKDEGVKKKVLVLIQQIRLIFYV